MVIKKNVCERERVKKKKIASETRVSILDRVLDQTEKSDRTGPDRTKPIFQSSVHTLPYVRSWVWSYVQLTSNALSDRTDPDQTDHIRSGPQSVVLG
jgi:hypothetical protein